MAFRTVIIENEVDIKVNLNNLVLTRKDDDIWIPINDISIIVLDNAKARVTSRILIELAKTNVGLIICDGSHLPIGYYGAYDNHSRATKIIGLQIEKDNKFYGRLWKEIVIAKLQNQAKSCRLLKGEKEVEAKILDFAQSVSVNDSSNREAHAAKVYFNCLMGTSFSRGNEDILLNSGLDYGYSIVRAYIARLCVAHGLNTQIGIHHKNEYNRFNLVDDLIEPIRPFVDVLAYRILDGETYFKPEHRHLLVNIINNKVLYRNKKMFFGNMLDDYIKQVVASYVDESKGIVFPEVDGFLGEVKDEV